MAFWLFKSEPNTWGWDDQLKRGAKGEHWDGVRNFLANKNMKQMRLGDRGFFYHSVNEKQIVGIAEVSALYHPDPTDASGRFGMVTIRAVKPMAVPVTLGQIKSDDRLAEMALVRQSRLSVTPVSAEHWAIIMEMGKTSL